MRRALTVLILLCGLPLYALPGVMGYRGFLTQAGVPVTGTKNFSFSFFNVPSGGGALWTSGVMPLPVVAGVYEAQFGAVPASLATNNSLFLEVGVEGTPLVPREQVVPAASALNSHMLDGMHTTQTGRSALVSADSAGNVGIGTNAPKRRLHVRGQIRVETNAVSVAGTNMYLIPSGAIALWSGTLAAMPAGWVLCDGLNGTPDLRDRFVMCVNTAENPGAIGGQNAYAMSVNQMPAHIHTGWTDPAGDHCCHEDFGWGCDDNFSSDGIGAGWAGDHQHTFVTDPTGSGAAIDNRPAYYELAFIMKK